MKRISLLHDEVKINVHWDDYNWSVEPKEDLKTLKKDRAQQIRDTYDYVILYHSGGADSTTMINAFFDNGIIPNEVINVCYDSIDAKCLNGIKPRQDIYNKGHTNLLNQIVIKYDDVVKFLSNDKYHELAPNFTGGLHSISRFNVNYLEQFSIATPKKRTGSIAHVYGLDDPMIAVFDDVYFAEPSLSAHFQASYVDENVKFFTDPKYPKLHVKQCYLMAKAMKRLGRSITPAERKMLLRDEYDPLMSPERNSNVSFITKRDDYTEPKLIFSKYKHFDNFLDLYHHSTVKYQMQIQRKIDWIQKQYIKLYKMEV